MEIKVHGVSKLVGSGYNTDERYFSRKMQKAWKFVSAGLRGEEHPKSLSVHIHVNSYYAGVHTPEDRTVVLEGISTDFDVLVYYLWQVVSQIWRNYYRIESINFQYSQPLESWQLEYTRLVKYPKLPPDKIDDWCARSIHQTK
jgi:hypothetical protein